MSLFTRAFPKWLPVAVAASLVLLLSYTFAQQVYRMGADDPQIDMARAAAAKLAGGATAASLVPSTPIDPSHDLGPFLMVLDAKGDVLASSMFIGATKPVPPSGVLAAAKVSGENRVTWQPNAKTRIAAVVVPVDAGGMYVVTGRSLRVVEEREAQLGQLAGLGWLGTMALTLLAAVVAVWLENRVSSPA
jgi:hypothetical protein